MPPGTAASISVVERVEARARASIVATSSASEPDVPVDERHGRVELGKGGVVGQRRLL